MCVIFSLSYRVRGVVNEGFETEYFVCLCLYYYSIKVFPYIGITRNRKKEIIQNLIQHEIGKDLKHRKGNHPISNVGQRIGRLSLLSRRLSLLLDTDGLWLGLVVA